MSDFNSSSAVPDLVSGTPPRPKPEPVEAQAETFPENRDSHGPDGKFLPGNQAARRTGIYARHQPADLRLTVDELMQGIVSDQGGETELSTLERSYIRKLGDLEITIRLLAGDIATNGLTTPGGRVRDVYPQLLSGLTVFDRYAQQIGLKRRARHVRSLAEVMANDGE